ncbi:MAG: EamA family transporter [Candidatus Margulisbacteria bacterium]|nr:EamA family transporter [Candidatus Margulisiibacteriota bacterium]
MNTRPGPIMLMIICTIFTSTAQILYKTGANNLKLDFMSIITNWPLILGLILYGLGAGLVIIALKEGNVTVLYPIITSSYVWVTIASSYIFHEIISKTRWLGIILIILGILMITLGEKDKEIIKYMELI